MTVYIQDAVTKTWNPSKSSLMKKKKRMLSAVLVQLEPPTPPPSKEVLTHLLPVQNLKERKKKYWT